MTPTQIKALLDSPVDTIVVARQLVAAGIYGSEQMARKAVAGFRVLSDLTTGGHHVSDNARKMETDLSKGTAREEIIVDVPPNTLEDALLQSRADMDVWEVEKWIWNNWADKYQVKLWFRRKVEDSQVLMADYLAELSASFEKVTARFVPGSGIGVVMMADFHYGMDYAGSAKSAPFSIESLTASVIRAADAINAQGLAEVHLCLLGDLLESFSGLNHLDAWKNLSAHGWEAVRGVCKMLVKHLIARINNLKSIRLLPGNHDRISPSKDVDSRGEAAKMVADTLELMTDIPVHFDYICLNPVIDGVRYILSHGHLGISKQDALSLVLEYGSQDKYNVIAKAHLHNRVTLKGLQLRKHVKTGAVSMEGSNYRSVTIPPMVTGGAYSDGLGVHSRAGITVFRASGLGGVNHYDLEV